MFHALLLALQLAGAGTSFADAKARAEEYESALSVKDSATLVEAQGKALSAAMVVCGPAKGVFSPFSIVARVGKTGITERTWRSDDSPFATCLDRNLAAALLPVAAGKPFYVSYDLSFAP